ncbi:MAG: hypothetical protein HC800_25630 [Phormidesmis sp. RL_2_1]|nr:hypothetical protein [Phormidesmis sp. RL_2_1]
MVRMLGVWELSRYSHVVSEIWPDDDGTEMDAWLLGAHEPELNSGQEQRGLHLTVRDGAFTETVKDFAALMFDQEGVQVNDYQPMSGQIVQVNAIGFLMPFGTSALKGQTPRGCFLRYDDGDTKVCDTIRLIGDRLVRQLSVVTDELYLDRMTLVYYSAKL